ncbi:BON domain-containing protein [Denitrificimonas caeni]|uniref:BON domain-containing protein n=1 Tax=Denitrificimonas caeni TaxID=521720 RepID=UPI001E3E635A|nr:BON domain-containing protein [Denitrificimonas caeni]
MKILNRKNAGLMVMTALLSIPLTQIMANENSPVPGNTDNRVTSGQDSPIGADQGIREDQNMDVSTDSTINNEVKSSFSNHNDFRNTNIDVKTDKGEVSLSGEVSTEAQRDMAINKAKAVKGVKNVNAEDLKIVK